jgi:hypothetical protein
MHNLLDPASLCLKFALRRTLAFVLPCICYILGPPDLRFYTINMHFAGWAACQEPWS